MLATMKGDVSSSRHGSGDWAAAVVFLRQEAAAADAMEGVVWMAVKGFEPPCAIIFGVGISIKIVLLDQFGSVWPT